MAWKCYDIACEDGPGYVCKGDGLCEVERLYWREVVSMCGGKSQALHVNPFCPGHETHSVNALLVLMTPALLGVLLSVLGWLLRTACLCCNVAYKCAVSWVLDAVSCPCYDMCKRDELSLEVSKSMPNAEGAPDY